MKKEFLDCKNIRECVELYLEETKGKERDAEFDLGFIASLYDNYYWDLEDEVLEIERKRRINQVIEWAQ